MDGFNSGSCRQYARNSQQLVSVIKLWVIFGWKFYFQLYLFAFDLVLTSKFDVSVEGTEVKSREPRMSLPHVRLPHLLQINLWGFFWIWKPIWRWLENDYRIWQNMRWIFWFSVFLESTTHRIRLVQECHLNVSIYSRLDLMMTARLKA